MYKNVKAYFVCSSTKSSQNYSLNFDYERTLQLGYLVHFYLVLKFELFRYNYLTKFFTLRFISYVPSIITLESNLSLDVY